MDMSEHIKYWLDSAAHDIDVADTLYKTENMIGAFSLVIL